MTLLSGKSATEFAAQGSWNIAAASHLDRLLQGLTVPPGQPVRFDLSQLGALDIAGSWLLHRTASRLKREGNPVEFVGVQPQHRILLDQVAANDRPIAPPPPRTNAFIDLIAEMGEASLLVARESRDLIAFIGLTVETAARTVMRPSRLRLTALVHHMEQAGLNAMPIVGLTSFLVGVVLAYQAANQLQKFGADIFAVNLIGISVLREIGVLLTAIVVAGRSGSAFTAQLGVMKVREEVDAMRTLGLDPMEILVLPRVLALVLTLPLLAFFADLTGLLGGGLMAWAALGISPEMFVERLRDSVNLWTFLTGMIKAPAFAAVIAIVGCFEGLRVQGSAESLGKLTTRSVVEALFLVIVADAAFSIFFSVIGV